MQGKLIGVEGFGAGTWPNARKIENASKTPLLRNIPQII